METGNFLEMRVFNKVNETNLERITIIGLFGRYNIDIPFNKQVNIFIGENGLGKTTILNCIYFVLEKKFSRLANMQFSEIKIKFKKEKQIYTITLEDIREYNKVKDGNSYRYIMGQDMYINETIERIMGRYQYEDYDLDMKLNMEQIAFELARRLDFPLSMARNQVMRYITDRRIEYKSNRRGNRNNVEELGKAISRNVSHRIIYLPTYRRIEDDFTSLNIRSEEFNKTEQLIRFGMSDVQNSIERILDNIRSLAMQGFTSMTGILLKQYIDGENPLVEMQKSKQKSWDTDTVKIVLDRMGKEIASPYKKKIYELVENGDIQKKEYLYLWNLISKLIDNYGTQRAYDDRIKKFIATCNKYLIDKHFDYNQSMLYLNIFLDKDSTNKKEEIQLTQLSSGEKQIVSLFSNLYLESDKRSIVIIDEPELSLSLEWQKMLLPDIMRTGNCDLLLTVTHSPFIFENEFDLDAKEIRRYIKKT